jgi:hypothetical protein
VICVTNKCGQRSENCPTPSKCMGGGNYHAEYAENSYTHVHAPAPVAVVKPHIAPVDDDGADFAKAIVKATVFLLIVACVLAAAIYH